MVLNSYLKKHSFCKAQIRQPAHAATGIIVVIPCFNEPALLSSLESLWICERPACFAEIIVVINSAEGSSKEIMDANNKSFSDAGSWIDKHWDEKLRFFLLKNNDLPANHAGVGLARKIGMDEAVARFASINNEKGIIACFDADSVCDKNYLVELESHFNIHKNSPGSSIYFEHPVKEDSEVINLSPELKSINEGIILYELFLRYYRHGLKFCGLPYAFHTIGSSMAVRAGDYCAQGGMNKRKAGEDFYFLQKIIQSGNFTEINSTRVIPSPRASLRVPFGTGRAISDFLDGKLINAYNPQTFADIRKFKGIVPEFYGMKDIAAIMKNLPEALCSFLISNDFNDQLAEIVRNSSNEAMFIKRFYRWFDGFKMLKFAHFARDNFYGQMPVAGAALALLRMKNSSFDKGIFSPFDILEIYRKLDKKIVNKLTPEIK